MPPLEVAQSGVLPRTAGSSKGPAFLLSLGSDCGLVIWSGRIWLLGQIWLSGQQVNCDEELYLTGFITLSSLSASWHHFR